MVTQFARYALHLNIDPLVVAQIWGIHEDECWDYLSELSSALREAERTYTPPNANEYQDSIPEGRDVRIAVLKERLLNAKRAPGKYDVQKILTEVKLLTGQFRQMSPQMIEQAKAFPIEKLLTTPVRRGMALCPLHNEKTPSFTIRKNNTYKCFGCGASGDSIALYRLIHNADFITAVNALQ